MVDTAGADGSVLDKPGVLEDLQMLRDRRSADRELAGEFTYRTWTFGKAFEDRAPHAIGERTPFVSSLVSGYER